MAGAPTVVFCFKERAMAGLRALEANDRPSSGSQVVVGSIVQVDLAACLDAQPEPSNESLKASTRIEGEMRSASANARNRAGKGGS